MTAWVVFSDLDGTLLDAESYAFDAARAALDDVRRRGIPLVLCTTKTAAETMRHQQLLGIDAPFVVEDGAALYVRPEAFPGVVGEGEARGEQRMVPLTAVRRGDLRAARGHLTRAAQGGVRWLTDLSPAEAAASTGLAPEWAALALEREFDEPFLLLPSAEGMAPHLDGWARELGLRVQRGGRFHHLHGETDKGYAVCRLTELWRRKLGDVRTLALGDSALDRPMLAAVDVAVAVARPGGGHDPALVAGVAGVILEPGVGPAGWNAAVRRVLAGD